MFLNKIINGIRIKQRKNINICLAYTNKDVFISWDHFTKFHLLLQIMIFQFYKVFQIYNKLRKYL